MLATDFFSMIINFAAVCELSKIAGALGVFFSCDLEGKIAKLRNSLWFDDVCQSGRLK